MQNFANQNYFFDGSLKNTSFKNALVLPAKN